MVIKGLQPGHLASNMLALEAGAVAFAHLVQHLCSLGRQPAADHGFVPLLLDRLSANPTEGT